MNTLWLLHGCAMALGAVALAALLIRGLYAAFHDVKKEVKDDSNA